MIGTDREARIKERAYQIWEREGRPDGRHLDHWRRAEQEIESQAERSVLKRSMETPNPAPEMHPSGPAARSTGAEAADAGAAKRTVKRKQTQSEAKTPRTRRPRTSTPKSTG